MDRSHQQPEPLPDPEDISPDLDEEAMTAELVAFLDGELKPEAAEAVQAKLGMDAGLRQEAEGLKKTWDLLDYLPRPEPSPQFTAKTISRILPLPPDSGSGSRTVTPSPSSGTNTPLTPGSPPKKRLLLHSLVTLLLVVGSVLAGWFGRALVVNRLYLMDEREQDARILPERRLLQNIQSFRYVDDLEFLKALDHPDLFGDEQFHSIQEAAK